MKFLIFLSILALSLARVSAIGITLDYIQFNSFVNGVNSTQTISSQSFSSFSSQTIGPGPGNQPRADVFWQFTNTSTDAIFEGDFFLSDIRNPTFNTSIYNTFHFTLTEPATIYSITGKLEITRDGAASLSANIGTVSPGFLYGSAVQAFIPGGTFNSPPITGTLTVGKYAFVSVGSAFFGGEAREEVSFRLHAVPQSVPDSGSTLMIIGMALATFGGIARRLGVS